MAPGAHRLRLRVHDQKRDSTEMREPGPRRERRVSTRLDRLLDRGPKAEIVGECAVEQMYVRVGARGLILRDPERFLMPARRGIPPRHLVGDPARRLVAATARGVALQRDGGQRDGYR